MSVIKQVLFNDGEGIEYGDLQLAQQFVVAGLWETLLGRIGEGTAPSVNLQGIWYGDAGVAIPAGSAMQVQLLAGMMALPAADAGTYNPSPIGGATPALSDESQIVPYWLPSTFVTHAVGHATLPRWDTLVVTVEWVDDSPETRDFKDAVTGAISSSSLNKRRTAVLTKTVLQGTPGASPTLPTIPSTHRYVPVYSVYVPATHNAVFTADQLIDHRFPAAGGVAEVYAADVWNRGAYTGTWTIQTGGAFGAMNASGSGATLLFAPVLPRGALITGIEVVGGDVSGTSSVECRRVTGSGYGSSAGGVSLGSPSSVGSAAAGSIVTTAITPSSTTQGLVHTWLRENGYSTTQPGSATGNASLTRAALKFTAGGANDRVTLVRFYYRGGVF